MYTASKNVKLAELSRKAVMGTNVSKNVQVCAVINHFLEFKDIIHKQIYHGEKL